jgi:ferredoxin-NADP reductase/predicted pyridoxine 5'-phosphate oxidase superfamily flavin-nucleotide-binding protein
MATSTPSPFHPGEQAIQRRVGAREQVEEIGRRFIRDHLPPEHREFYAGLSYLLLGSIDETGRPWASILVGPQGFVRAPDDRHLQIAARPLPGDPAREHLVPGAAAGVLGIDFTTRRRNRMNGRIDRLDDGEMTIAVDQSFGNCPMYIQVRELDRVDLEADHSTAGRSERIETLSDSDRQLIRRSDSFFIATHFAAGEGRSSDGADVSHRGGRPGFVRIAEDGTLTWPDFTGNSHFNTLGNIELNPRAGLLFIDYESGSLLSLTGSAEIVWDGPELHAFKGAERLVRFRPESGWRLPAALPLRWRLREYSPVLQQTGSWEDVDAAMARGSAVRPYAVTNVVEESSSIRSIYLRPADGGALPCHVAGQFLPLALEIPGHETPVHRTYTISNAPDGAALRLSIKREQAPRPELPPGLSSSFLHDSVETGTILQALPPRGTFLLDRDSCRPVVLLSAGVGVTPMIAMLEQLANENDACGPARDVYFVHGARNGAELAFANHVRSVAAASERFHTHIAFSAPLDTDVAGRDYDSTGRIGVTLLKSLLPLDDYDFYLCGPEGFMREIYQGLRGLGIARERIHYEFFGPAARLSEEAAPGPEAGVDAATVPVPVRLSVSGIDTTWSPGDGTLLDFAEAAGLSPPYSCRAGVCQTCATPVDGEVAYREPPMAPPPAGQALICCAYPVGGETDAPLTLEL